MSLRNYIARKRKCVNGALKTYLPSPKKKPITLSQAMRYSLLAGGKRLRPILCLAAAETCGGKAEKALPSACALECIHTFSLVHDDLPSMDNDDLRRGIPTNHKVFGEGIAVLVGDALQALAFEILTQQRVPKRYSLKDFVEELAITAGSRKLIAGQVFDLEAEGKLLSKKELRTIHENKTAAMITTALRFGGMSADATPRQLSALTTFGHSLGLAFQVVDDILDETQSTEKLGKSAGKDKRARKATYPAVWGQKGAQREAEKLTKKAEQALDVFEKKGERLHALAQHLLRRSF